jgi:7 transmembrane receptor (rhodopsin family)
MSYQLSPTDQQILYASSVLTTYGGLIMFSLGMIGNTINIAIFCCLKAYRSLTTSAFLAAASFSGQVYLCFSLLLSALSKLLGYSPMSRNLSFCRAAQFIPRVTVQISLTCICLSAIDRYLMTSRSARQRSWVTPRRARLSIVGCIIIWLAYGVPSVIYGINYPFFNICIPGPEFSSTVTYLNLVFAVLLPITILCLFGFLTWRNLERARLSSMNVQVRLKHPEDSLSVMTHKSFSYGVHKS